MTDTNSSRVNAILYDQAGRGIQEMAEMLRKQIAAEAAEIATAAEHPVSAGYLSGRTAQLHDWATRLGALRSVHDGWFRDNAPAPDRLQGEDVGV